MSQEEPSINNSNNSNEEILEKVFTQIVQWIDETPTGSSDSNMSTTDKLRLYGLFKHIKQGPWNESYPKPSWLDFTAQSKYQAYQACHTISKIQALQEYITIICKQKNAFATKCQEYCQSQQMSF